jgi:RimJ/RimL family protein N-acetyltransferase
MAIDISLRDVEEDDLPFFYVNQLDPDACRMAAFPSRGRDEFIAQWARIRANESVVVKTIIADGAIAGNILLWEQEGKTLIGYWLGEEFWGRGIASAALSQFLTQVKARPLYAYVAKQNAASIRVLVKCGFMVVGEDGEEFLMGLG